MGQDPPATLVLVRHAQASFLSGDYDRLSELGQEQARLLGEYWHASEVVFDRVLCGPRKRHRGTEEIIRLRYSAARRPWPEPVFDESLDEYAAEAVVRELLSAACEIDEGLRELRDRYRAAQDIVDRRRLFQEIFEPLTKMWQRGEVSSPSIESWWDFEGRVESVLERIRTTASAGERIVAVTSSGPIAVALRMTMGFSSEEALERSWWMRNCSFAEFSVRDGDFALSQPNEHPHLVEDRHLTYR